MAEQLKSRVAVEELLDYLWRWKIVPTWMVHHRFFHSGSSRAAYHALHAAKNRGLVSVGGSISKSMYGWSLTEAGFRNIADQIQGLIDRRYVTEAPVHDLLVAAVVGGIPLVLGRPNGWTVVSEQQIRCIDPALRPWWFARDLMRRPDGYWRIGHGNQGFRQIALEVELSRKDESEYGQILQDYQSSQGINDVLWITGSMSVRTPIWKAADHVHGIDGSRTWSCSLSDLSRHGLKSVIRNHLKETMSLGQLLHLRDAGCPNTTSNKCWKVDPFKFSINFSHDGRLRKASQTQNFVC